MTKSLFDEKDREFAKAVKEIYVKAFKEKQEKLRELGKPGIEMNEEQILRKVEETIKNGIMRVDPFEFAKEILATKYGVAPESIRKRFPASFTKRLRSQFPNITEEDAKHLIDDVKKKEIAKRISDINKK